MRVLYIEVKHIPRFFVRDQIFSNKEIFLSSDQMHHASNVLRLKENDKIYIFNELSGEWLCLIKNIKKNSVIPVNQERVFKEEPGPSIACALINPNKFAILLEKVTELGVKEIHPITTEFTQYKSFNEKKFEKIVQQACEQSKRISIPKIYETKPLKKFLDTFDSTQKLLVGIEKENTTRSGHCLSQKCAFLVGPEGGFSDKEIDMFSGYDFVVPFHFGQNILRSETAAIAFIAAWVSKFL